MIAVALNVHRQTRVSLTRPLGAAIWTSLGFLVTNTMELAWPTAAGTMLFAKLSYPFSTAIPVLFFLFTLAYTDRASWFAGARSLLLFVIPAVTTGLAFTEPLHGLIWTSESFTLHGRLLAMSVTYGWFFWVNAVYDVGLLLGSMFLLAWETSRGGRAYRAQSLLAIIGICFPLALFFVYALKIFPGFTKNFSPIAYCVPAFCFMAAIHQHGFLDLVPVARRTLLEEMADAMIVVDGRLRVLELNEKARLLLGLPAEAIGLTLPSDSPVREVVETAPGAHAQREIEIPLADGPHYYDARVTPVLAGGKHFIGSIVLLRDVSDTHRLLEEIDTLRGIIPICMYCKKVRDDEGYWHQVESYISARSFATFSHGLCPECLKKLEQEHGFSP